MRIQSWRKNDHIDRFQLFCYQNIDKPISVEMINDPKPIKGVLYDYCFQPLWAAGIFVLLTPVVIHPAFYSLDNLKSMHSMGYAIVQALDRV